MVKTKEGDGIKSSMIVDEVRKRACLYDSNHVDYGDRCEKAKSWEEVYMSVVPAWGTLGSPERSAAGKEVQKRWRSIRDSYTKAYRLGKWQADRAGGAGGAGSRRSQYHAQMAFLLRALQNKKPRYSQDKYDSLSDVSNSPQHHIEESPKVKHELEKPVELKTKPEPEKPETVDKANQVAMEKIKKPSLEIKIDANSILPDDHFDDDRLFMNSLLPLFKKMNDDTRLLCRIEVLKVIRYALQGANKDSFRGGDFGKMVESKREVESPPTLASSRPQRKKRVRSPSPLPTPPKKRGPGRPRKIRPPPSDSDSDQPKKRSPKLRVVPVDASPLSEMDETMRTATSVAQLPPRLFMQMYNLERSKGAPCLSPVSQTQPISVKSEPREELQT